MDGARWEYFVTCLQVFPCAAHLKLVQNSVEYKLESKDKNCKRGGDGQAILGICWLSDYNTVYVFFFLLIFIIDTQCIFKSSGGNIHRDSSL